MIQACEKMTWWTPRYVVSHHFVEYKTDSMVVAIETARRLWIDSNARVRMYDRGVEIDWMSYAREIPARPDLSL